VTGGKTVSPVCFLGPTTVITTTSDGRSRIVFVGNPLVYSLGEKGTFAAHAIGKSCVMLGSMVVNTRFQPSLGLNVVTGASELATLDDVELGLSDIETSSSTMSRRTRFQTAGWCPNLPVVGLPVDQLQN
jgi:hypothetical protein